MHNYMRHSVNLPSLVQIMALWPLWHQAIIWSNAAILSIRHKGTYFREILFKIQKFSFKKMHLKMLSIKWQPFCLGLNVLRVTTRKLRYLCYKTHRIDSLILTHFDLERPVILPGGISHVWDGVSQVRSEGAVDVGQQLKPTYTGFTRNVLP